MRIKHKIKVKTEYFQKIESGEKTLLFLLKNWKRKSIKEGNVLCFIDESNKNNVFISRAVNVYHGDNFDEVCKNVDFKKSGHKSRKDLLSVLEEYFPLKKQNQKGVMAIEIQEHNE